MTKRNIPYNKLTFMLSIIGFIGSIGFYIGVLRQVYSAPIKQEVQPLELELKQENGSLKLQVDTLTKIVKECEDGKQ